jgi:hypothetical protein
MIFLKTNKEADLICIMLVFMLIVSGTPFLGALEIERPNVEAKTINRLLSNATVSEDNRTALGLSALVYKYYEEESVGMGYDQNHVIINVSSIANTRLPIQYSYQNVSYPPTTSYCPWMTEEYCDNHPPEDDVTVHFNSSNNPISGGIWVQFTEGFLFRFYGGLYKQLSGVNLYCSAWISTQGFVSLDLSQSNSSCANGIPDELFPNAVIAPLWTNLTIDNQARIVVMTVEHYEWPSTYKYFVVIWKNAKHEPDGRRLTFAVALKGHLAQNYEEMPDFKGDPIYMAYQNVDEINTNFIYGVEDQEGKKGNGSLASPFSGTLRSTNSCTLIFSQYTNNIILRRLDLGFYDTAVEQGKAAYRFVDPEIKVRGTYLENRTAGGTNDFLEYLDPIFEVVSVIDGLKDLYDLSHVPVDVAANGISLGTGVGAVVTFALLTWDLIGLARDLVQIYDIHQTNGVKIDYLLDSLNNTMPPPWNKTASMRVKMSNDGVVDASLNAVFALIMLPKNDFSITHNLTITATAIYQEYDTEIMAWGNSKDVHSNVSMIMGPDNNNGFETATAKEDGSYGADPMLWLANYGYDTQDFYKVYLYNETGVYVNVTPEPYQSLQLFLYEPDNWNFPVNSSTLPYNVTQSIHHIANETGWWYINVTDPPGWGFGFYNMTIDIHAVGDINDDDWTDIYDAITLAKAYGSIPGDSNWNPTADIQKIPPSNNTIDIYDAIKLANHFGEKEWTPNESGSGMLGGLGMMSNGGIQVLSMGSPIVQVDQSQSTVYKGDTAAVNIRITDVVDLAGWEFKLYWNSTVLNCTSAVIQTPTEWQGDAQNYSQALEPVYNATHGRFWAAQAANYPAPSFNGSMAIAALTFQALQPGTTSLTLADTKLGNSTAQPIDHTDTSGSVTVYYGRYMRSDTKTVNGLNAYLLNATRTTVSMSASGAETGRGVKFGIRVWKRSSGGTETEISLDGGTGTPGAVVTRSSGSGIQSATTSVGQMNLSSTDSIVVRVYAKGVAGSTWSQIAQFTTEQLGATSLLAKTWTVYYYTWASYNRFEDYTAWKFYWGSSSRDSRIQNLQHT